MESEGPGKALIVLENSISSGRARSILKQMGWECVVCGDGDRAVDEYVPVSYTHLTLPTKA